MGLVAEYEVRFPHLPLVDVAAALPAATLSVDVGQPNQGEHPPFVVHVSGGSRADVVAAFDESSFVDASALVGRSEAVDRYQIIPSRSKEEQLGPHVDALDQLRELSENESIVENVVVTASGWRQRRWFADRAAFDEYRRFWQRNGDGFTLHELSHDGAADGGATGEQRDEHGLTDRQREALLTANEMGYFDVPRRASLGDLAEELGIARASASERLRRGQAALVDSAVATELSDRPELKRPSH